MSYILEALKKSDQERQRNSVPTLQAYHVMPPATSRSNRSSKFRGWHLFAGSLCVLMLAGIYLLKDQQFPVSFKVNLSIDSQPVTQTSTQAPNIPDEKLDSTVPPKNVATIADSQTQPAPEPATPPRQVALQPDEEVPEAVQQITYEPAPLLTAPPTSKQLPESSLVNDDSDALSQPGNQHPFLHELPEELQSALPELRFAGHTYSDAPDRRMILINQTIRREGDTLAPGLQLEEITWEGVVLNYLGSSFQVDTTN